MVCLLLKIIWEICFFPNMRCPSILSTTSPCARHTSTGHREFAVHTNSTCTLGWMTIRYDVNFHVARSSSQSPSQNVFLIDFVFIEPKILRSKYLTASQIGVTFLLGYYQVQQTRNSSNLRQHVLLPLEEKNSLKYNLHVSQFVFRFCIL